MAQKRALTRTDPIHTPSQNQTFVYAMSMSTIQSTSAFHDRLNTAVGDTSYRQLGTLTDTHPETVRRYMQGQAPSAVFMTNLCRNLGISGEWLLSGQGPMKVRDIKTHALKHADPNELMGAIANTLTQLIERVDRLDRFVQMMETKLNATSGPIIEPKLNADTIPVEQQGSSDDARESGSTQRSDDNTAKRIARAIAQRPHDPDA
jgi:transcriptional regulator with XRE-family HTH domain